MFKNKKLISFIMAMALSFQLIMLIGVNANELAEDYENEPFEYETPIEDSMNDTIVIEGDSEPEVVDVDIGQVEQDLEDTNVAFIEGWVLFDSQLNQLPQTRNVQGAMRYAGALPSTSYDLRHVSSVWNVPWEMHRYEAFVNGRWVAAFCVQPGIPSTRNPDAHPGWSQGFDGLTAAQRNAMTLILLHGYDNVHGFNVATGNNTARVNAYVATQVLIWEVALGFWNTSTTWNGNSSIPAGVEGDAWRRLISNTGQMVGGSNSSVSVTDTFGVTHTFYPRPAIGNQQRMGMYDQIRSDIWTFHGQVPTENRRPVFTGVTPATSPLHTLTWNQANGRYQVRLSDAATVGNTLLNRFINMDIGEDRSFGEGTGLRITRASANVIYVYATSVVHRSTDIHTSPTGLLQINPQNSLPVMFWMHPTLQDKITGNTSEVLQAFFRVQVQPRPRGGIEVQKNDYELNDNAGQGDATLQGAIIEITNITGESVFTLDGGEIVDQAVFSTITTDANGIARTPADYLPEGRFKLREIASPDGYLLNEDWSYIFEIEEEGVIVIATDVLPQQIIRGDVEVEKWDIELDSAEAMAGTSLAGIEFEIINRSSNAVLVDGTLFEPDEVIKSIFSYWCDDAKSYVARTTGGTLPYGTFEITEVSGNMYYLIEEELDRPTLTFIFKIRENSQTVRQDENDEQITFNNQVRRGDISGVKIAEGTARRLSYIPFAITNQASNETNVIVTNTNGEFSTDATWNPRSNANINNHLLDIEANDELIMNSDIDMQGSIWFATGEFGGVAPVHETLGALTYGWYTIREMRAENNVGFELLEFDIFVSRHGHVINLGTMTNMNEEEQARRATISTQAWVEEYGNQYFWWGDDVYMTDTIRIRLYNTAPGTIMRFNATLHNRTTDGATTLVYSADYYEFEVPYDEGWQMGEAIELEFEITTTVPIVTGDFEHDSEFFWSENLYEQVANDDQDQDDDWDLIYEHNPEGDDPLQTLFPRYATIATQAHTGDGSQQFFWQGETIYAYDIIKITHSNIPNGTQMYYSIFLFAVPPHIDIANLEDLAAYKVLIWYDLQIPYTVDNVLMTFEEMTTVDTSEWYGYTLFFAERLYAQSSEESDEPRLVYEHNFDGSCLNQRITPMLRKSEQQPESAGGSEAESGLESKLGSDLELTSGAVLPQTGSLVFNITIIGMSILAIGSVVGVRHFRTGLSKDKVIKLG